MRGILRFGIFSSKKNAKSKPAENWSFKKLPSCLELKGRSHSLPGPSAELLIQCHVSIDVLRDSLYELV